MASLHWGGGPGRPPRCPLREEETMAWPLRGAEHLLPCRPPEESMAWPLREVGGTSGSLLLLPSSSRGAMA